MTPAEIVAAYSKLQLEDANEAETRLKVIDEILFSVLGWTHADVTVEERVSEDGLTTFADYILRTGTTAVVIEAKRVGATFDNIPNLRRVVLAKKFVTGVTGATIIQARDYCRKLAIPFAVVTNGSQWIVFPATRVDQVDFSNSSAIIFPSIKSALQDDYAEFYDLLSRSAVISGALDNELLGRIENQLEERRLNRFYPVGFSGVSRHSLFPLIESAVAQAFSEDIVNNDPDLLEKCYVRTPERIRYDSRINMYIAQRAPVVAKAVKRPMRRDGDTLSGLVETAAGRTKAVAVLVLGGVGTGKTTFLDYTRNVASKDLFEPDASKPYPFWIRVDFRDYAKSEAPMSILLSALKSFMVDDPFLSDYERCIKHAYKDEIDALFRGPMYLLANDEAERKKHITKILIDDYEKTQPYVEKVFRYVAQRSPVFLVVDNVDQFEDEQTQSAIFSESMALAHRLNFNLVCSMRESTYVRHREEPTFDAFDFDVFVIDPPRVEAVLSKRFFVARQLLEGKPGQFTAENGADFKVSSLATVIDLVQASVLGTELGRMIDVLATSNVRLALRMTREFLRSGYTATGRALQIYQSTGNYIMPQHEALRAIMLGNRTVYSEEFSVIGNPFDARLARTEAQMLRLYVLAGLTQMSSDASFRGEHGVKIQHIFRELGFGDDVTINILTDLCRLNFIQTLSHSPATFEASYLPTRLGGHVVRHVIANLTFVENVMMDTFISDAKVWDLLRTLTDDIFAQRDPVRRLSVRVERAKLFFDHISTCYQVLRAESLRRGLPREWCSHPLSNVLNAFTANLERALASAKKNYGSGSSPSA